ncbi:MAG: hypothetical protein HQK76_12780 [Desulfobacterales bacterium]|nr:hypothetical protein [Desulfobacterales bacterium]
MKKQRIFMILLRLAIIGNALSLLENIAIADDNLLTNGDFENASSNWHSTWTPMESGWICTQTAARSGNYGAWVYTAANSTSEAFSYFYQDISASSGEVFTASAYIQTPAPSQWVDWAPSSYACVRLAFLSSTPSTLVYYDSTQLTTADTPYGSLYSVTTPPAPEGTVAVRFICYLYEPAGNVKQSVVNFDDCTLEKIIVQQPQLSVNPVSLGFGNDITTLSFNIKNSGSGTLSWNITKNCDWFNISSTSGTTTTETDTITVTVNRSGLNMLNYNGSIAITSNNGDKSVDVFMETTPATAIPTQPALVTTNGYELMLKRRLPNGALDIARPYIIKGAAWSPSSIGTISAYYSRRAAFGDWYRLDIQLLKEMNANTVYVFLDFGTDVTMIATAKAILDYCYQNGIMVVMTADENGSDNTANIPQVVNTFKNHPAILMWALGNEWNLWRPDRPKYYNHYDTLVEAANAMQSNALLIKSLDNNHPVASILGEINYPTQTEVNDIVNSICTAVDVWGANIYRGHEFYMLFTEWKNMSTKPLFLSEFGTDAFHTTSWWPPIGYEDETMQADYVHRQCLDLSEELSAKNSSKVCLGGTVFEFNDEWLKCGTGEPDVHDNDGYETTWNPIAHPDGFANEEWFGIVSVDRERRESYYVLKNDFGSTAFTLQNRLPMPWLMLLLLE